MSKYMQRARALVAVPAVLALVAVAACSGDKKNDTLAQDSTLNRDMQLANADTAAKPALNDVPAAKTPAPAPSASAARPRATTPSRPAPTRSSTPTRSTTASGNTVTRTPGAAETPLGTIAAGTSIAL